MFIIKNATDDDRVNNLFMLRKLLCLQMRTVFFIYSISPVFHNNEIMALKSIKDFSQSSPVCGKNAILEKFNAILMINSDGIFPRIII